MKTKIFATLLFGFGYASCEEVSHRANLTVKVIDDKNNPVSSANVGVTTFARWEPGQGFGTDIYDSAKALSNKNGEAKFRFTSKTGKIGIGVDAGNNYYRSVWPHYQFTKVEGGRWTPDNPTIIYILKRKLNPIPLYAKSYTNSHTTLPKKNEDCGYDLEMGDWVMPYGKGVISDIIFQLAVARDNGIYDNDCTLKIRFSNPGDGLISSPKPLNQGSELRLDHLAPVDGYKKEQSIRSFTDPTTRIMIEGFDRTQNYYLRVRTELDQNGKVIRANYAKIHGDFEFWYTGDMKFTHYFNPKTNDRNLEFDPARNLFKGQDVPSP